MKKPVIANFTVINFYCPHCTALNTQRADLNHLPSKPMWAMTCANGDCKKEFVGKLCLDIKTTTHVIES